MEFLSTLAGIGLNIYQVETDNSRERRRLSFERQRALADDKSNSKIMVLGLIVVTVLGVVYLKNRRG